jgi:hypothetical protein
LTMPVSTLTCPRVASQNQHKSDQYDTSNNELSFHSDLLCLRFTGIISNLLAPLDAGDQNKFTMGINTFHRYSISMENSMRNRYRLSLAVSSWPTWAELGFRLRGRRQRSPYVARQ